MRDRRSTTIAVLAGGVALAGAGFAIGSQRDDGSALALSGDRVAAADQRVVHLAGPGGPHGPGGPMFDSLADRLGVSEAKLREALDSLRPQGEPGDELAAALAKSLGVDQAKVDAALENLRSEHERAHEARHAEHAAALAKALGIEASRVRAALDKVKPPKPGDRRTTRPFSPSRMLSDLAKELGVTTAKLRAAMREVAPPRFGRDELRRAPGPAGPGMHRAHHGPRADIAADLAKALGVEEAEVEDALEAFHDARHEEFTQKLADKLGIDVGKVREALPPRP